MLYSYRLDALKYAQAVYGDPTAAQYVKGTALHWYDYQKSLALDNLDGIHDLAPSKFMLNTEACVLEQLSDWCVFPSKR